MLIIIMLIPFHTKCLPVSICKIITHKITKTTPHAYRLLQLTITCDCSHLVDATKLLSILYTLMQEKAQSSHVTKDT